MSNPTVLGLATDALRLATAARQLSSHVAAAVDPIAGLPASRAAGELDALADLLEDPELELRH